MLDRITRTLLRLDLFIQRTIVLLLNKVTTDGRVKFVQRDGEEDMDRSRRHQQTGRPDGDQAAYRRNIALPYRSR